MAAIAIILLLNVLGIGADAASIDVLTIASKTKSEVEAILGKPSKIEMFNPEREKCQCERFYYLNDQLSIIYREEKSNRIYISNSIKILNLDKVKINSFHKWIGYSEIRVTPVKECCNIG